MQLENATLKRCSYDPIKDVWNITLAVPDFGSIDYTEARSFAGLKDLLVTITSAQLRIPFEEKREPRVPASDNDEDLQGQVLEEMRGGATRKLDPERKPTKRTLKKLTTLYDQLISRGIKAHTLLMWDLEKEYNVTRYANLSEAQGQQVIEHYKQLLDDGIIKQTQKSMASTGGCSIRGELTELSAGGEWRCRKHDGDDDQVEEPLPTPDFWQYSGALIHIRAGKKPLCNRWVNEPGLEIYPYQRASDINDTGYCRSCVKAYKSRYHHSDPLQMLNRQQDLITAEEGEG